MGAIWLNGSTPGFPNVVDVLRRAGVNVVEFEGWKNRSRSSGGFNNLMGVLDHHTASQTSIANDLNYCVYGSPDAPVSNGLLDRTGTFTVIAAGASNHGGKGGGSSGGGGEPWITSRGQVPPDASNSNCFGIECCNNGVGEPYPEAQQNAYIRINRALVDAYGMVTSMDIRSHAEWSPPRKIDPRGPSRWQPADGSQPWNMNAFRDEVAGTLPAPTPGDDDMPRMGNPLIQGTGKDGSFPDALYLADGLLMTYRYISSPDELAAIQYKLGQAGLPTTWEPVDMLSAYGTLVGPKPGGASAFTVKRVE